MANLNQPNSLAPTLLLSMPQLNDPEFHQTVVLLCEHDSNGAFGFVLNRPTSTPASAAVRLDEPLSFDSGLQLWLGGPLEPYRGWILTKKLPEDFDTLRICEGLHLSASPTLLRRLLESPLEESRVRFLTGYAGWAPGQLDDELSSSAWLTTEIDVDLIFGTDADLMWETGLRRLGADPALLQIGHGVH